MNAVYFKGNWLQKFDATLTEVEPFYLGSEDKSIDTEMMHIYTKLRSGYLDDLNARVLELPYVVYLCYYFYFNFIAECLKDE